MVIKHFLVTYDIPNAKADVESFDTDYEAAVEAYSRAEHEHRDNGDVEVVLLGSDSYEAVQRTHSSYFMLAGEQQMNGWPPSWQLVACAEHFERDYPTRSAILCRRFAASRGDARPVPDAAERDVPALLKIRTILFA